MFSKAELVLIKELREQKASLERWAKFFPDKKISDLLADWISIDRIAAGTIKADKIIAYYQGQPITSYNYIVGETPSESTIRNPNGTIFHAAIPGNPETYARGMKKGNIYRWDDMQDNYLKNCARAGISIPDIIKLIEITFGITRTAGAISSRIFHLGLPCD